MIQPPYIEEQAIIIHRRYNPNYGNDRLSYIEEQEIIIHRRYNPNYGNDRLCICGHVYYRHFDSYEDMSDTGCKYCSCGDFKEFSGEFSVIEQFVRENSPNRYEDLLAKKKISMEMDKTIPDPEKNFNQDLLEEHYRLTQRILNPLMGINSSTELTAWMSS